MKYGWIKDEPDERDFRAPRFRKREIPKSIDMRKQCPPIYDQGNLGSCTANAVGAAYQFTQWEQMQSAVVPSRLFIYRNTRELEGTIDEDSGATLRNSMKAVNKFGVCDEVLWPYVEKKFREKPPAVCYDIGTGKVIQQYARVQHSEYGLKEQLASNNPIVFGFIVFESFESDEVTRTGIMPMPKAGEAENGGHAVMIVGYDDITRMFLVRNSWGTGWGIKGYFWMPYAFVLNKNWCFDFWTIMAVP